MRQRRLRIAGLSVEARSGPVDFRPEGADVVCCFVERPATPGWHRLPGERAPVARDVWLRPDGRVVHAAGSEDPGDLERLVRWALPFAAALQGRVVLHASAVQTGDHVVAFCGASGSGKSSLAAASGLPVFADDLLGIEAEPGAAVHAIAEEGDPAPLPLDGLLLLRRSAEPGVPRFEEIGRREALRQLCHNGFGELPVERVWARQFDVYADLARRVPALAVVLPESASGPGTWSDLLLRRARRLSSTRPATT